MTVRAHMGLQERKTAKGFSTIGCLLLPWGGGAEGGEGYGQRGRGAARERAGGGGVAAYW
jgi:hypothetical protein